MLKLTRRSLLARGAATGVVLALEPLVMADPRATIGSASADSLRRGFLTPPDSAKAWCYWWWLDGASSHQGITADLTAMRQQGISGALLFNGGSGSTLTPKGPAFMSPQWRENFRFAVREAGRLGIAMVVNLCDGWNCGGPWVTQDDAIKDLVWQETIIEGPGRIDRVLIRPSEHMPGVAPTEKHIDWYRDIAVLACREGSDGSWRMDDIRDLTDVTRDGRLQWDAPSGRWTVLRLGYVVREQVNPGHVRGVYVGSQRVKYSSSSIPAWEVDPMSSGAMDRHFAETGAKLIDDAGDLAGSTLKYLHIDSWELGVPTWTAKFPDEFRARRGYDPTRYLPALAGKKLDPPQLTTRFRWDYRRTVADLIAQNYYGRLATLCHQHGLGFESESGGPFFSYYADALECEGVNDIPMAEFWSNRFPLAYTPGKPVPTEEGVSAAFFRSAERDYPQLCYGSVRQEVSAAHIYGKPISQAEAYTNFNPDWTEDPYFLKALGDRAFCLGLTRQVLCFYVHQSTSDKPGYQWEHVGTHFDRNVTWFPLSHAWLTYLARCQHMLRHGQFCADILYFDGQTIPNFALMDKKPLPGFDFDVINAQALLERAAVKGGKVVLPGGLSYRYLVLPEGVADEITPAVLGKIRQLVAGGATLVGTRPRHSLGLVGFPHSEEEVRSHADALWGAQSGKSGERGVGKGRVIWGRKLEEVIRVDGVRPDVELRGVASSGEVDWTHRYDVERDIYFLANLTERSEQIEAVFRVSGGMPELWDPVTGQVRDLPEFRTEGDRTVIPLSFAAKQSWFVVFRRPLRHSGTAGARNFPSVVELATLEGPWDVAFDVQWGAPARATFERLEDWSKRPEGGIRYYSGMATYRKRFDAPRGDHRELYLDLGEVRNIAQVRLNGKNLGVVWTAPWRVAVGDAIKPGENHLEIDVVNLWPNRLIGDGLLPKGQRLTRTNVRTYDTPPGESDFCGLDPDCAMRLKTGASPKLLSSGLLGPVKVLSAPL
jgi:alpha-L-rhamnosidase